MAPSQEDSGTETTAMRIWLQVLLAVVTILYVLQLLWNRKWTVAKGQLPPGSMGYYGVGESLQLLANFEGFYSSRLQKHGHIFKTHIIGNPTVRVVGSENVKHIIGGDNPNVEAKSVKTLINLLGTSAISNSTGKAHKNARKQVAIAFKKDCLESYIEPMCSIMERTLADWCDEESVLVAKRVQAMTLEIAWQVFIGSPLSPDKARCISSQFQIFIGGFFTLPLNIPGLPYYKALKAKDELHKYIHEAINICNLDPNTMLGMMMKHKRDYYADISTQQIKESVLELLFAGHEGLSSAATSLVAVLSRDKDVRSKLMEEMRLNGFMDEHHVITFERIAKMSYLSGVIKEVFRMYPPIGGVFRSAKSCFKLGEYTIPEGWTLIADIRNTQQQADFDEPNLFKPERWLNTDQHTTDYSYIPFGAGPRVCVGREYVKLFLRLFTVCMLRTCRTELVNENVQWIRRPVLQPRDYLPTRFMH